MMYSFCVRRNCRGETRTATTVRSVNPLLRLVGYGWIGIACRAAHRWIGDVVAARVNQTNVVRVTDILSRVVLIVIGGRRVGSIWSIDCYRCILVIEDDRRVIEVVLVAVVLRVPVDWPPP